MVVVARPKPGSYIPPWLVPIPLNTRDVADVLRALLDKREGPLARWLYSTTNAQGAALKYQEIRNAIRDGDLSEAVLERWRQDYARVVAERLDPVRQELYRAVDKVVDPGLVLVPTAQSMAQSNAARNYALIKNVTEGQRDAVRALLAYNAKLDPPMTVGEFAKVLRPCIGLTEREAKAVARWRDQLAVEGFGGAAAEHSVQNYAGFLLRRRADRIARTELSWSFNAGQQATIQQAQAQGVLVTEVRKVWAAAGDEMTCPTCGGELNGVSVGLHEDFPGGLPFPPAHPNCRCGVIYEAQRTSPTDQVVKPKPTPAPPVRPVAPPKPVAPPRDARTPVQVRAELVAAAQRGEQDIVAARQAIQTAQDAMTGYWERECEPVDKRFWDALHARQAVEYAPGGAPAPGTPGWYELLRLKDAEAAASAERDRVLEQFQKLDAAYQDTYKVSAAARERARTLQHEVLYADKPGTMKWATDKPGSVWRTKGKREKVTAAVDWLNKVLGAGKFDGETMTIQAVARRGDYDCFTSGRVRLTSKCEPSTIVHEVGHMLEHLGGAAAERVNSLVSKFGKLAQEELNRRTAGEAAVRLSTLTGNRKFRPNEVARPDRFASRNVYMGKSYFLTYRFGMAAAGTQYATEMTSMALQRLYEDPLAFMQEDPVAFDWIWSMLRGLPWSP